MSDAEWTGYTSNAEIRARHHRSVLLGVVGPVVVVTLVLVMVLVVMIIGFAPNQVNTVASFMSLLLLVPTVILCFLPYILIVAVAAGSRKLYLWLPPKFETVHTLAHRVNLGAQSVSKLVARPIIAVSQRLAWIEQFLSGSTANAEKPVKQIESGQVPMLPARTDDR